MGVRTIFAGICLTTTLAACQTLGSNTTVAEHCANPDNANQAVCQLNVEINGQQTALADTDLRLSEARAVADSATESANEALNAAQRAQATADDAMARADAALADDLYCETRTVQQSKIGTCAPGFKVMSCAQTRYTYRAGGPSIMREINDEQCRFHDRILEMQVRCCASAQPETAEQASYRGDNPDAS